MNICDTHALVFDALAPEQLGEEAVRIIEDSHQLISARHLIVLPIIPDIAALSASKKIPKGDPTDRLIAATAISHGATLITRDERLIGISDLPALW